MSTRCQVRVIEGQNEDNEQYSQDVLLYHHSDGYPEGQHGMVPHFWRAYLFGVTPYIKPWEKDKPNAEPSDFDQWRAYRAGYAASYLCHVEPRGFSPESVKLDAKETFLHGDIEWYYKLYVCGKTVKGQKYQEWELEIYKVGYSYPKLILKRTPLSKIVNKKGFLKADIFKAIEAKVKAFYKSEDEENARKAFANSLNKMAKKREKKSPAVQAV